MTPHGSHHAFFGVNVVIWVYSAVKWKKLGDHFSKCGYRHSFPADNWLWGGKGEDLALIHLKWVWQNRHIHGDIHIYFGLLHLYTEDSKHIK